MMNKKEQYWISRVLELQPKMGDHLVCDEHADRNKLAMDWLDETRDVDRLKLMEKLVQTSLENKDVLEIGSGVGSFALAASRKSIHISGIEPVAELVALSKERLQDNGFTADIRTGSGESLPFEDNSFDFVVSFQVLEHVTDPEKVINESLRVLRPNGRIFFIIPSYQSFWEGHYGIFWWPNLHASRFLMRSYIRIMQRDPAYADTLNFITPNVLRRITKHSPYKARIENLGYEVWRNRLSKPMPAWGYTKKLMKVVAIARSLHLLAPLAYLGKQFEFYTPIIFVCRKIS